MLLLNVLLLLCCGVIQSDVINIYAEKYTLKVKDLNTRHFGMDCWSIKKIQLSCRDGRDHIYSLCDGNRP